MLIIRPCNQVLDVVFIQLPLENLVFPRAIGFKKNGFAVVGPTGRVVEAVAQCEAPHDIVGHKREAKKFMAQGEQIERASNRRKLFRLSLTLVLASSLAA